MTKIKLLFLISLFGVAAQAQSPLTLETTYNGITQHWAAGANVNRGQIVKINSTGQVVPVAISDTTGAFGVAVTSAQQNGDILISIEGSPLVIVDGACVSGNIVSISSTLTGNGHCSGVASGQTIGVVVPGSQSTGFVNVQLSALSSAGVSGGGGGTPGNPTGSTQVNNPASPGTFGGAGCEIFTDKDAGPINQNCDLHNKGPNPSVDITNYSSRSINTAVAPQIPGITATINNGSANATISLASTFQNGDGVTLYGAGGACSLTTPAAPTVTVIGDAAGIGTGQTVAGPSGGTTYSYKVVPVSATFCFPIASAAGSIGTGPTTIGAQSSSITSCSSTGTVATCVTGAQSITVGMRVLIQNTTNNANLGGWVTVDTVPDTTHFTFTNGIDATGSSISSTGGTVYYWTGIDIATPAISGTWEYCVYRTAPVAAFIGCTRPQSSGVVITDLHLQDFGTSINGNMRLPAWLPSTPPAAGQANALTTTISSGAGTTNLVLASTASTSVTNQTILFDNCPTAQVAANAARAAGSTLLIPYGSYVFNSYCLMPGLLGVMQQGGLVLNGTLQLQTNTYWQGAVYPSSSSVPSFGQYGNPVIFDNDANPGVYADNGIGLTFDRIAFNTGATNNANMLFFNGTSAITLKRNTFVSGSSANDLRGTSLILRATNGAGPAQFYLLEDNLFIGGPAQTDGLTSAPQIFCQSCGYLRMKNTNFSLRSIVVTPAFAGVDINIEGGRDQGGIMPLLTIYNGAGAEGVRAQIYDYQLDTMSHPILNLAGPAGDLLADVVMIAPGLPGTTGSPVGLISGRVARSLFIPIINGQIGQNVNLASLNGSQANFSDTSVAVNGVTGDMGYAMTPPAAPGLALSGGGSVPVGTWTYVLYALDANGFLSQAGPGANITTTGGNQTVTITPPSAPSGGLTYVAARSNGGGFGLVNVSATPFGTNMVDTFGFTAGTPANVGFGMRAGINSSGVVSPQFTMASLPTSTWTANALTLLATSAVSQFLALKNTTAAVVGTSQGSPFLAFCGRAFHGSADVESCANWSMLPGNGNDAPININLTMTGTSTGIATTNFPGPVAAGPSAPACTGGTAGSVCMAEGTDVTNVAGATIIEALSTTHELGAKTNGSSSAGILERVQPGPISLSAQTAAISTATLCASAAGACNSAGAYHVHWSFIEDGTACSTPSTGGVTFLLTWTDANGTAHSAISLPMEDGSSVTSTSGTFHFQTSLAAAWASGDFNISSNGSIIQYATGYTACSVGTGSYRIQAEVTRLQ